MSKDIIIAGYARTPMGGFQGALSSVSAPELGAVAVKAAVERSGAAPEAIDRIYMGCVLPAALGQAPARQAALGAGLPQSVEATTVNKMCGSGMQAAIMAAEALSAGAVDIVVAGGMESMTNAPYALPKHRSGARIGHDRVIDTMMMDGLEDAYDRGKPMGAFAEDTARDYQFTRAEMDAYAVESLARANAAIDSGAFAAEVVPVTVRTRGGEVQVDKDEQPGNAKPEKIPSLKPAFAKDGAITAASSASISDGAAALVLTRADVAEKLGLAREARIVATASHAHAPALFTTAPVFAIRKVLEKAGWSAGDVDLYEVNEAFAAVAMIAMRDLDIPHDRINVNGGATALGHPIGASGARIIATLVAALKARGLKKGVAALCIGGGEATAVALEIL
ncbi:MULTISPECIES: acetyl-CoA C-acyltransferase [Sphingobium]|uniref:Acetyl-CoA acetyltransferase n=1 Tax=Sphingobium fuliginis (strain ATCC 27551) TaxID=336203 RepID=A0ABQ1EXK3_SPHSA|nr:MULTISPECIES: acetyl-CoA C-acyltransferase [Sphingobium]MCB4860360.1 acetyl-CoA C-acyltransferase [Sphingobium sp. PNB]PNP96244.1 acetyl-CoA acetyltransferase [Sphingobium sp. SA916]RYL98282.1 acetyl-CoA C-acyltransferase [Sphingobium fuliginis]WDA35402.1 acetyl-CoA C-acyltransferase [Sphingobium sp. YC-XJ3]GFZ90395.1 acetyl-CoA acetyltransferase [Sphingobium fuliginis]